MSDLSEVYIGFSIIISLIAPLHTRVIPALMCILTGAIFLIKGLIGG